MKNTNEELSLLGERLRSSREAADFLGVSMTTLWRERSLGKIGYRRIAGSVRYTEQDLLDYLERALQPATA